MRSGPCFLCKDEALAFTGTDNLNSAIENLNDYKTLATDGANGASS